MYIDKITFNQSHGGSDVVLQLATSADQFAGWVVVVGDNGAGKSYLLQRIAQCLYAKTATSDGGCRPTDFAVHLSADVEHIPSFPPVLFSQESHADIGSWLGYLHGKSSQKAIGDKPEAEQLIVTLMRLLNDDFLPPAWQAQRIDDEGLWLGNRHAQVVRWTDAGHGIRSAVCLLITILRAVFGVLAPGDDARKAAGVVLIDDIELHLHPAWQRQIGFWLIKHFPLVQFIVCTHSPLICQAAQQVFVLSCLEADHKAGIRCLSMQELSAIQTSRPDTILRTAAFGLDNTRSPLAVESRARYAKLQSKKRAGAGLSNEELALERQVLRFVENGEDG